MIWKLRTSRCINSQANPTSVENSKFKLMRRFMSWKENNIFQYSALLGGVLQIWSIVDVESQLGMVTFRLKTSTVQVEIKWEVDRIPIQPIPLQCFLLGWNKSFLLAHWHSLFWTSGDICPGFQSQGGSLTCIIPRLQWIPQIHLWCNSCLLFNGQYSNWAFYLPTYL